MAFTDSGDAGRVVTARGTEDGLVLRIDGRAEWAEVVADLELFLGERRKFLKGGQVSIEWLDRLPTKEQTKELETVLRDGYGIEIVTPKRKEIPTRSIKAKERQSEQRLDQAAPIPLFNKVEKDYLSKGQRIERTGEDLPPFDHAEHLRDAESCYIDAVGHAEIIPDDAGILHPGAADQHYIERMTRLLGDDFFYDEDANAKTVFGTLRSGQRVETPYTLVVVGDVNPGADLIAGGDIIVFGSLRGTAHAGAYDDEAFDRVIVALQMQPMQLRIGSVISRGNGEVVSGAEIARIESRRIVVESFNSRAWIGSRSKIK
jgi:hypothetical protein